MVQEAPAKTGGRLGIVSADVVQDLAEEESAFFAFLWNLLENSSDDVDSQLLEDVVVVVERPAGTKIMTRS